jgi:hypothetical protein
MQISRWSLPNYCFNLPRQTIGLVRISDKRGEKRKREKETENNIITKLNEQKKKYKYKIIIESARRVYNNRRWGEQGGGARLIFMIRYNIVLAFGIKNAALYN